jgi:hypothetical protein
MRQGEPVAAVVSRDAAYAAKIYTAIEESREFLAQYRAAHPSTPHDPDELQARMMRRSGCPTVEHYVRVFRAEGMSAEEAAAEEPAAPDAAVLREQVRLAGGDVTAAHVAHLAAGRRWPVLSDRPNQLSATDRTLLVEPV